MISLSLTLHIFSGFVALFSGCTAIIAPKGKKWHILAGRIYIGSMTIVTLTALHLSIISSNPFLLVISIFSFYLIWSGGIAIYWKNRPLGTAALILNVLMIFSLLISGLAMIVIPTIEWFGVTTFSEIADLKIVLFVFGILGISFAGRDLFNLISPPEKNDFDWLYRHISRMGGAYIATCTAFAVVNITFLPDFILWLGPTFIGSPLIAYGIRRHSNLTSEVLQL